MILFKLLLVISAVSIVTVFSQKNGQAYELAPGCAILQQGFDLNKLDLFPAPGFEARDGRGQKNLIDFTFNKGAFFDHPLLGKRYSLPDQVASISPTSKGTLELTCDIHTTLESHAKSWGVHTSGEASVEAVTVGRSASYQQSVSSMIQKNKISAKIKGFLNSHFIVLDTSTDLQTSKGFKEDYSNLTGTYESNHEQYDTFLEEYGTHFYTKAWYGGQLSIDMLIDKTYSEEKSEKAFSAEVHAGVAKIGSFSVGGFYNNSNVNSSLDIHSDVTVDFFGGKFVYVNGTFDDDKLNDWQTAIQKSPWQIGGLYTEIYHLVKDEDIKYELMNAMYSKFSRQSLQVTKLILELLVKAHNIQDDDKDLKDLCSCTLSDVKYYLDQNLGRHVPVRQEVFDLQEGVWKLADVKRKFHWLNKRWYWSVYVFGVPINY